MLVNTLLLLKAYEMYYICMYKLVLWRKIYKHNVNHHHHRHTHTHARIRTVRIFAFLLKFSMIKNIFDRKIIATSNVRLVNLPAGPAREKMGPVHNNRFVFE